MDLKMKNLVNSDNIKQDLLNISWANVVEEELADNMKDDKLIGNSKSANDKKITNVKKNKKNINLEKINEIEKIENILKINLKNSKISDIELIKYQNILSSEIKKQIRNIFDNSNLTKSNLNDIIQKLDWIFKTSQYLSNKIGLPVYYHNKNDKKTIIPRSSYKFCSFGDNCQFNYNTVKYKGCYAHHFVHNMVSADIGVLRDIIIEIFENKIVLDKNYIIEIKKSINTISYVINHMFNEIKIVNLTNESNNIIHLNRILNKSKSKKKKNKRKTKKK